MYLSFLRSPIGAGLTDSLAWEEMEPCDWLLTKEVVSRLRGDRGGVMRLVVLQSEWDREPGGTKRALRRKREDKYLW